MYGIGHSSAVYENHIVKDYFDITDCGKLEKFITLIKPDIIIHLAGISQSDYALSEPIETLHVNGMVTAYICDIIYRNNLGTILFNASSSEIFKGHRNYEVNDNSTHMHHLHPYSIAKVLGHTTIDFYRKQHGMPFSNGILFTTESPHKSPRFLLNKVAKHIASWKLGNTTPLSLGSLESYRDIVHAADVALAIDFITREEVGNTYVICTNNTVKILDVVVQMYDISDLYSHTENNILYSKNNEPLVVIGESIRDGSTNIRGNSDNLRALGWKPQYTLNDMLKDILVYNIVCLTQSGQLVDL